MNKKYIILNKEVGETPLSLLEKFKANNPDLADKKLAYAGRLDPMASGKLLVLIGDECKKQNDYLELDKEYEFEVLLGFSSDSGDVLGLAEYDNNFHSKISKNKIGEIGGKFTGNISMPFPHFSSKTVNGKPLFLWTLENKLSEIEIPVKNSFVYKLSLIETRSIDKNSLYTTIFEKVNSIPKVTESSKELGRDFRRDEIRKRWNDIFENIEANEFQIVKFKCVASSGTYMRSLALEIGVALNTKGLAFSIHRTKIGRYKKIFKSLGFWYKKFS